MKILIAVLTILTVAPAATGQTPDDYRGGWRTEGGEPHTYEFSIRGDRVRGIYCTRCSDATTLAFVDGTFGPAGITFVVTHVSPDGSTSYQDRATARFDGGKLIVAGTSGARGGGRFERILIRDPRGPDPLTTVPVSRLPPCPPLPRSARVGGDGPFGGGQPYVPPGPWTQQLKESDVIGVWVGFHVGLNKQFFIVRRVGNRLRGMVCGRCDNPYTMAALDDFHLEGDTLSFAILHEDWGPGSLPFQNRATGHLGLNEMRLTFQQDNTPSRPASPNAGSSLFGPIAIEATAGNDSR